VCRAARDITRILGGCRLAALTAHDAGAFAPLRAIAHNQEVLCCSCLSADWCSMTTAQKLEIRCGNCGYWMPAPESEDATHPLDAGVLIGAVVQCRKCLKRTVCSVENMRAWAVPDAQ